MRVAIIHYWLVHMRGGERVLEQLCELFPQADIYTHVIDEARISDTIKRHKIATTFISRLPMARKHYQKYLGLMPRALEALDLGQYDLVISSEAGPAKGIIPPPRAKHICYCHSPMRYIWDQQHHYEKDMGFLARHIFRHLAHDLRIWDVTTAARVDEFVANSSFIAQRIKRYYARSSTVVHPPVDLARFKPSGTKGEYYLFLSQLVPYKRADLVVEAFRGLDRPVIVAGEGAEESRLRARATPNVKFIGRADDADVPQLYANCRALLFPSEEDFGIVPVEALASGRPVIAYGQGGVLDSIQDGETGLFFKDQTAEGLREAVLRFEQCESQFSPGRLTSSARRFSAKVFREGFMKVVNQVLARP